MDCGDSTAPPCDGRPVAASGECAFVLIETWSFKVLISDTQQPSLHCTSRLSALLMAGVGCSVRCVGGCILCTRITGPAFRNLDPGASCALAPSVHAPSARAFAQAIALERGEDFTSMPRVTVQQLRRCLPTPNPTHLGGVDLLSPSERLSSDGAATAVCPCCVCRRRRCR